MYNIEDTIVQSINREMDLYAIPNAIVKVLGKVMIFHNDNEHGAKIYTNDTNGRLGSITKTVTSTAILQLVDNDMIKLDDKLHKWFPNIRYSKVITIEMLLNMTSGIPNYTEQPMFLKLFFKNPSRRWKFSELLHIAEQAPRDFYPGTNFHYCNTNYLILGKIIALVSGQSYEDYVYKNIVTKENLDSFQYNEWNKPEPFIKGVTLNEEGQIVSTEKYNYSWAKAAGQYISNIHDLYRWAKILGQGKLISKKSFKRMISPNNVGFDFNTTNDYYGLGINVNNGWLMHTGSAPGYASVFAYDKESKYRIAIMVGSEIYQGADNHYAARLAQIISRILTPDHPIILGHVHTGDNP